MASTNRPLDESTATLVSPDDHLRAKDLLSTPTKASTGVSSGTVSDEEPSTPEPGADDSLPVSIKCGWPHGGEGEVGELPAPNKKLVAAGPDGQPPWGTKGFDAAGDGSSGWPHLDGPKAKNVSVAGDGSSGWPHLDGPKAKNVSVAGDGSSGWPHVDGPHPKAHSETKPAEDAPVTVQCGWPGPHPKAHDETKPAEDAPVTAQCGWPGRPVPGDADKPDPAKHLPRHGTDNTGRDAAPKDGAGPVSAQSGWPHVDGPHPKAHSETKPAEDTPVTAQCGWPHGSDPTPPPTAGTERRKPGTVGPEGQPPWGVKSLAEGPEGQPPWGIKSVAGPDGQPPWGVKNVAAAAGPDGQPPWGTKGFAGDGKPDASA